MFGRRKEASDLYAQPVDRREYEEEGMIHRTHDRLMADTDDNEEELISDNIYTAPRISREETKEERNYREQMEYNYSQQTETRREEDVALTAEMKSQKRNFKVFVLFLLLNVALLAYIVYLIVTVFTTLS